KSDLAACSTPTADDPQITQIWQIRLRRQPESPVSQPGCSCPARPYPENCDCMSIGEIREICGSAFRPCFKQPRVYPPTFLSLWERSGVRECRDSRREDHRASAAP